ncbi:MAG: caspase family protein [Candidatus Korobacteraceae bacterium]
MRSRWWSTFLLLCLLFLSAPAPGQTKRALLIGIDQYHPEHSQWLSPALAARHKPDSRFGEGPIGWHNLHGPSNDVEQMELLLKSFGFDDVAVLREPAATQPGKPAATRQGIFDALRALAARTHAGDVVVFYYSGHGSRRLDTTRPPDADKGQWDQTIVPADAYQGAYDITDKELAREFNHFVYEKRARLVAIFDSCNSGTQARGLTAGVTRSLPYDDRDVKDDPQAYTGADLKHVPKDGNAVILSAAGPLESAQDGWYPDDQQYHGAFTRALITVLKTNPNLRGVDVINSVDQLMRADQLPAQQPSVEGKVDEPLFGGVIEQPLRAAVTSVENGSVTLNLGSLAGFGAKTTFRPVNEASGTILTITSVDSPTSSTASVSPADGKIAPGDIVEMARMVYPEEAKLRLYVSSKDWDPAIAPPETAKALFPGFEWKADPALDAVQYFVIYSGHEWKAMDLNGQSISPDDVRVLARAAKPRSAFLALPPTKTLVAALEAQPAFQSGGIVMSDQLAGAHYLLGRQAAAGLQYALFRSTALGSRPASGYIESSIFDKNSPNVSAQLKRADPKVVCGQTDSFPVRSEWVLVPDANQTVAENAQQVSRLQEAAASVEDIGKRIAKLRAWMELLSKAGDVSWPYRLEIERKQGGPFSTGAALAPGAGYEIALVASKDYLSSHARVSPQYVYVIGADCSAHIYLLYPDVDSNGGAGLPQARADDSYPDHITLNATTVGTPFGADSIFLLTTPSKITDLSVFAFNGVVSTSGALTRGTNGLGDVIENLGDASARGWPEVPSRWTVQHVTVPSTNRHQPQ